MQIAGFSTALDASETAIGKVDPKPPQPMTIGEIMVQTMRDSYYENMEDLNFYAESVKDYNEAKSAIRDELTAAREHQSKALDAWMSERTDGKRRIRQGQRENHRSGLDQEGVNPLITTDQARPLQ